METIGLLIMAVGGITLFVGGIWMLIEQFKTSIIWGLGCIFIPFVSLIWLIMHWEQGAMPFFVSLGGAVVLFAGAFLTSL